MLYKNFLNKIKFNKPFTFSRWGDGEFQAINLDKKGANCDGHKYFPDMSLELEKILESNPTYYTGLQPLAQKVMPEVIKEYDYINWVNADVFHDASINGEFNKFLSVINEKRVVIVGPDYMNKLNSIIKTIKAHIVVPRKNCWLEKDRILSDLNNFLSDKKEQYIVLFAASMASNIMIHEIQKKYKIHSFIDIGSVLDPYIGHRIRGYHEKLDTRRTLLAITTFNQSDITKICLDYVTNLKIRNLDIVIFDDHSTDDTFEIVSEYDNVKIITRPKGKGCTYSWNEAYRYFKEYNYDIFLLISNDVLIPNGAIEELLKLSKDNVLCVPLTTKHGAGHRDFLQAVSLYYDVSELNIIEWKDTQLIQNSMLSINKNKYNLSSEKLKMFNGFAFLMNKDIIKYEHDKENLFNPKNINVGNEDDLNERMSSHNEYATLCKTAYMYHFKDATFNATKYKVNRENLNFYQENHE